MGVDAEMFVRVKGRENWLRPEHELAAAYELASSVGADNFFVQIKGEKYPCKPDIFAATYEPVAD